ncbi:MAG TPA: YncE family protein [Bryobacteraceae bacterium]|nr:YncE family protein [Bryobacteraceae bacterium]
MTRIPISRRAWLLISAGFIGCGRKKAPRMSGYCFVANQGGRSIAMVSLERFRVLHQIPLDAAPTTVLAHPRRPRVLALAPDAGIVYEVDGATVAVSRKVRTGNQAIAMQLSPAGDALWVLDRDPAELVELPLDSLRPRRRIRLASPPDAFDLVLHSRRNVPIAAVVSRQNRTVTLASLASGAIEHTIAAEDEPSLVTFQSDGAQVIAGSWQGRSASIFDTQTGKTVVRLPLPLAPRQFCSSGDGGQIFVTGDGMDAVVVVFPYETEIYQTILAGHAPGSMAVTPKDVKPSYLMLTNPESDGITVLDTDTYSLVASVEVGRGPCRILLTPDGEYALVLNEDSGDIAVVRMLALSTTPNGAYRRFKPAPAPIFTLIPVGDRPVSAAFVG